MSHLHVAFGVEIVEVAWKAIVLVSFPSKYHLVFTFVDGFDWSGPTPASLSDQHIHYRTHFCEIRGIFLSWKKMIKVEKVIFLGSGKCPGPRISVEKKIKQWLTMWVSLWDDAHSELREVWQMVNTLVL